jgi:hypothetical protein
MEFRGYKRKPGKLLCYTQIKQFEGKMAEDSVKEWLTDLRDLGLDDDHFHKLLRDGRVIFEYRDTEIGETGCVAIEIVDDIEEMS